MPKKPSRFMNFLLKSVMPEVKGKVTFQERRERTDQQAERFVHAPRGDALEKLNAGSIAAEWHVPETYKKVRAILYLHGGAYTFCSPATHRALVGRIALASNARALVIAYRLAPEHPFPGALEDALAAWNWLVDQGIPPEKLVIAGDSAGGGLSLATALRLRDDHEKLPAALVLISPWVDLTVAKDYAGPYVGKADPANPLISPLFGDFEGMPATLIQAGGAEFLLGDAEQLNQKMKAAGVDVRLSVYDGMNHVFQLLAPLMRKANQAIREIGDFIQDCIP
jgi:monoterpene epsilon-lactone hydrolase